MQDKRLTLRLTEYWDSLRGGDALPKWVKFDPASFSDIWSQCCGWKIESGEESSVVFTYDYVGDSVKEAVGADLAGQKFKGQMRNKQGILPAKKAADAKLVEEMFSEHFKGFPVASIVKKIDKVVSKGVPLVDEGRFVDSSNKTVRYRSCLLPFGDDEGKISRIVLGLSWKSY